MKSFHTSIALKNALIYLGVLLLACVALGAFLFFHNANVVRSHLVDQVEHTHELIKVDFDDYIEDIARNVGLLSEGLLIKQVLLDPNAPEAREILSKQFIDILTQNQDYNQVRLIGAENGMELIRADRLKGRPELLSEDALQSKSDRSYYQEALAQEDSKVIFSPIDLNREYGVISDPVTPTLRAYRPIHFEDDFIGLVVINLDLTNFFERIASIAGPGQVFYVFTNREDYLIHPEKEEVFGFEYGRPGLAAELMRHFERKKLTSEGEENTVNHFFQKWDYPRQDYYLVCALSIDESVMNQPLRSLGLSHFLYLLLILTISSLIIAWIARRQSRYLSQVTEAMADFNEEEVDLKEVAQRKDEFGKLALAFLGLQTTIKRQIEQLTAEKAIAQQATRDKETFIENMSHELRNPLQNIKGMLSVLQKNRLRDDQQPIINAMTFSADQLEVLINDVLDFGLLKEGKINLKSKPVSINNLMAEIVQSHRFEAGLKQVNLKLEAPEEAYSVLLDSTRFTQIVSNLLSNAVKFSHAGDEVQVSWEIRSKNEEAGILSVQIQDHGRGMTTEQLSRVQDRFERVDSDGQGTGLGLPVVHELLKLFGSDLMMDSKIGHGTTCSFVLHLDLFQNDDLTDFNTDLGEITWELYQKPWQVLIIEDDPQIYHLYNHFIENEEVEEIHISSWSQWNNLDQEEVFDLIVSDIHLGTVDMQEHREHLLSRLKGDGLLLWCSGQQNQGGRVSAVENFLVKPLSKMDMVEVWNLHWNALWSQLPVFSNISADYDHDPDKLAKALHLLLREWGVMLGGLIRSFNEGHQAEAKKIYHRLTTTLKRLELFIPDYQIETWLEDFTDRELNEARALILEGLQKMVEEELIRKKASSTMP